MLGRRDTMVRAPTGSGKTLAYLVPVIQDLATQVRWSHRWCAAVHAQV